ncbi:MAG TPA: response regulator [Burkholderiaceae bacterium]
MEKDRVNILLVDDQASNLVVMEAVLAPLGENIVSVVSGEEALRAVLKMDFAVILLDVHMPTLSGFETARMIRARPRSSHIAILFVTAAIDPDFPIEEAYALGAVDYLSKPILPTVLRAKVAFFVELFRKNEELARIERARHAAALTVKDKSIRLGEQRFSLLVNSSGEGLFGMSVDTTCTFLNPAGAGMLGYLPQELVGRLIPDIIFSRNAAASTELSGKAAFVNAVRDGVSRRVHEEVFLRKDGTTFPVAYSISPMTVDGQVEGAVVTFTDITERKRTEDELRRVAKDMAEADRRRTEFLATLAHELRNPLAPLRNGLQVIRLAMNDPSTLARTSEIMERQLSNMVHLVDDLLDVARITKGSISLKKKNIDLASVINAAIETSSSLIAAGQHTLETDVPEEPVQVELDPTRIAQAIGNILNNAAKYTPRGGHIRLSVRCLEQSFEVVVTDSGIGIPADCIESVFTMFAQLKHGEQLAQGGLGIGLSLVRRLVELHGGSVKASSPGIGQGSTFSINLPFGRIGASTAARADTPPVFRTAAPVSLFRIVVADDNVDAANTLSTMLEILGHQVGVAHGGSQALEMAKAFKPDVVFLDIGMPDTNGYEVAKTLRSAPGPARPALVALTGWGADADKARAAQAGFDHHLTKPATLDSVNEVLCRIGERFSLHDVG